MQVVQSEYHAFRAPIGIAGRGPASASRAERSVNQNYVRAVSSDPHAALIDPCFALMARSWQRDRIVLGDHGEFAKGQRRDRDAIAVDLRHAPRPALVKINETRLTLSYDPGAPGDARGAMIASAACSGEGGWPIAGDASSLALLTLAERIAASDIPVLLEGPTGTGKEVFSRFMHRTSARADKPFIAVNCAAMPEAMLEGLLFGHRKGAFTGASESREGLFRAADGGTLLLDEIGELPLALQSKLLRTLQEGEVLPLGSTSPVKVDVRIIAATNRTLSAEVEAGRFREDLLYRLNVFPLTLPPLRERRGDLAPLAFGMLLRHACRDGLPNWISKDALDLIEAHGWSGNVRELENVIRRAILLAGDSPEIGAEHIVFDRSVQAVNDAAQSIPQPVSGSETGDASSLSKVAFQSEARAIIAALERNDGHRARTARSLNISERTLRYRLATMRENGLALPGAAA